MTHVVVPQAEAILDKEYTVPDHGFVRLVDYMGGDDRNEQVLSTIVQTVTPYAWEAFKEYNFRSIKLRGKKVRELLKALKTADPSLIKKLGLSDEA